MKKNNVKENNDFDIDLIIPEGAFLKNKARAIRKEKIAKRKRIIQNVIMISLLFIFMAIIFNLAVKLKKQGIEGCLSNGYSYDYCVVHS